MSRILVNYIYICVVFVVVVVVVFANTPHVTSLAYFCSLGFLPPQKSYPIIAKLNNPPVSPVQTCQQ